MIHQVMSYTSLSKKDKRAICKFHSVKVKSRLGAQFQHKRQCFYPRSSIQSPLPRYSMNPLTSLDSSQRTASQPPNEVPKAPTTANGNAQVSPSLRWLGSCSTLFKPLEKDSKDVLCMVEVLHDRVIRTDVVISGVYFQEVAKRIDSRLSSPEYGLSANPLDM